MALATIEDVSTRLGRAISGEEQAQVATLLDDVELILRSRIPDFDDRIGVDTYRSLVVMVESNAVARILRNPGGYRSESEGSYSYSLDTRASSGFLLILDDEWSWLGASAGAFTITPRVRDAHRSSHHWPWWETHSVDRARWW